MPTVDLSPQPRLITGPFVVAIGSLLLYFASAGVLVPAVPIFVEDGLGGGEFDIGATLVAFSVAAVAVRPVITWVGSRHGYRVMMVGGAVIAGIACLGLVPARHVGVVFAMRGLMGVGEAALFVGASALVADISPPERRAESASYLSAAVFGGVAVGPALGEFVLGDDRYDAAFLLAAGFCVMSMVIAFGVPSSLGRRGQDDVTATGAGRWIHASALLPGVVLALGIGGWAAFNSFVPTYSTEIGMSGSAGVFALYSVVCLVLRIAAAKVPEKIGIGRSVNVAIVSLGLGLVTLAAVPEAVAVYSAAVLVAVGVTFFYPSLLAASVNAVPESQRVAVISSFTMFFEVGAAVGGLVLGGVGELSGKRAAFGAGALLCVLGLGVLNLVLLPSRQRAAARDTT